MNERSSNFITTPYLVCPICKVNFSSKDSKNPHACHHPLLLHCGHSVCFSCVRRANDSFNACTDARLNETFSFPCTLCGKATELPRKLSVNGSDIDFNYYLFGWLESKRRNFLREEPSFTFVPAGANLNSVRPKASSVRALDFQREYSVPVSASKPEETCVECLSDVAPWYCQNCASHYCDPCFRKVHSHRAISNHKKTPTTSAFFLSEIQSESYYYPKYCSSHPECLIQYVCKDDSELMCANCVLFDDHKGHIPLKLEEKYDECRKELCALQSSFEEIFKALSVSIQAAEYLANLSQINLKKLADETQQYFFLCHSILQLVEKEAMEKIKKTAEEKSRDLLEQTKCLRSFQQELQFLKQIITSPSQDTVKGHLNLSAAVMELKRKLSTSVCLMVKSEGGLELAVPGVCCPQTYQLELQDIKTSFDRLFSLKENCASQSWEVVPLTSLNTDQRTHLQQISSPDLTVAEPEVDLASSCESFGRKEFESSLVATSSRHSSVSDLTTSIPAIHSLPTVPSKVFRNTVVVTCVVNPLDFYVRRVQDDSAYRTLVDNLRKWGECARAEPPPKQISPSKVYGMWNEAVDEWKRLRVMNELKTGFSSSCEPRLVKGQCVDTGERFEVPLSMIRDLSKALLATPVLALHCSLDDIIPQEGVVWNTNDVRTFKELLGSENLTLVEIRKEGALHYVDLVSPGSIGRMNQSPVTVRDTLVHMGIARFKNPAALHLMGHEPSMKYSVFQKFRVGEEKVGVVCHIFSPKRFYVQLISAGEELQNLSARLQHHYNQGNITKIWSILSPRKGMLCVARFSVDRLWYRAQIENVPDVRSAVVRYVDYGNTETLNIEELRTIDGKFLELPAMAICCKLANVRPAFHKQPGVRDPTGRWVWSKSALDYFKALTLEKRVSIQIAGVIEGGVGTFQFSPKPTTEFQLIVTLSPFEVGVCRAENAISINQLLVDEGYAVLEFNRPSVAKEKGSIPKASGKRKPLEDDRLTSQVRRSLAGLQIRHIPVGASGCQEVSPNMERSFENLNEPMRIKEDESVTRPDENCNRLEVTILDCQSPSEIIVCVRSTTADIEKMMDLLQLSAPTCTEKPTEWRVGDWCLIRTEESRPWKRAKIVAMDEADNTTATVFLVDAGRTLQAVPAVQLYPLPDGFKQYPASAMKVHLAGILPAGGSKWSFLAKELLQTSVRNPSIRRCYVEMKGEPINESVPVHLYCVAWHAGGALEPGLPKTHLINQELLDSGLALPIKGYEFKEGSTNPSFDLQKYQEFATASQPVLRAAEVSQPCWPEYGYWEKRNFKATPTWVDMKGVIYLQDEAQVHRTSEMKDEMGMQLERCEALEDDQTWRAGEMCSVKYEDGIWYRGQILQVKSGEEDVGVRLVDYGTEIDVNVRDLRKKLFFTDVPLQVWKCCLFNVLPVKGSSWDYESLDFLHKAIVDNECVVMVKEMKETPKVNLVMFSGQDVGELFVSAGWAKWASPSMQFGQRGELSYDEDVDASISSSVEVRSVEEVNFSNFFFVLLKDMGERFVTAAFLSADIEEKRGTIEPLLPPQVTGAKFSVLVTAVADGNEIWLQPWPQFNVTEDTDAALVPFFTQLNKLLPEFETMTVCLRNEGHTFPMLRNARPGVVCCALYEEDQSWYRSVVQDVHVDSEGKEIASILFVDYGNVDCVSFDKLRELPRQYFHIPAFVMRTKLPLEFKPVSQPSAAEELLKLLVGSVFRAQVLNTEPFECLLLADEGSSESEALNKVKESGLIELNFL